MSLLLAIIASSQRRGGENPCADYTPSLLVGVDVTSTDLGTLAAGIEVCREVVA